MIIAFVVNIAVFVPSFLAKTEHYYDLTGSVTYLTVTLVALATTTDRDLRTVLLAAMIVLGARLILVPAGHPRWCYGRFDKIKLDGLRFYGLDALSVTLTAGAALAAMTSGAKASSARLGSSVSSRRLIGFAIEVTVDRRNRPSAPIRPTGGSSSTSGCGRGVATPTTGEITLCSGSPSWRRPSWGDSTPPSSPRSSCSCCPTS